MTEEEMIKFWSNWVSRFNNNSDKYITPQKEIVENESGRVVIGDSNIQTAINAWEYVRSNIQYSLSKEWKEPEETINDGVGDCEDFTFLLASMFPNLGIQESRMVVGDLVFPDSTREFHTWNEVDGRIIDATGSPEVVRKLQYNEVEGWRIQS